MTGYTVHTGSTEKFSQGWDAIFGESEKKRPAKAKSGSKKGTVGPTAKNKRSKGIRQRKSR